MQCSILFVPPQLSQMWTTLHVCFIDDDSEADLLWNLKQISRFISNKVCLTDTKVVHLLNNRHDAKAQAIKPLELV